MFLQYVLILDYKNNRSKFTCRCIMFITECCYTGKIILLIVVNKYFDSMKILKKNINIITVTSKKYTSTGVF